MQIKTLYLFNWFNISFFQIRSKTCSVVTTILVGGCHHLIQFWKGELIFNNQVHRCSINMASFCIRTKTKKVRDSNKVKGFLKSKQIKIQDKPQRSTELLNDIIINIIYNITYFLRHILTIHCIKLVQSYNK